MDDSQGKRKRASMTEHDPSKTAHAPHSADRASHAVEAHGSPTTATAEQTAEAPQVAIPLLSPDEPRPSRTADFMPRERAQMILSMKIASLLLIDVRDDTGYAGDGGSGGGGGAIRGSLHVPARGFGWNRGILYELAYKSGMEWVVFVDDDGDGAASRCAGWYLDHVRDVAGDEHMQVLVLRGGVEGWVRAGDAYTRLMDGFRGQYWERIFAERERTAAGKGAVEGARASGTGDVGP